MEHLVKTNTQFKNALGYSIAKVDITISHYVTDPNTKAITLTDSEDGVHFATCTKFIRPMEENYVTLDTNNLPSIEDFLIENEIIGNKPFGTVVSGFCIYPIYKLHDKIINQIKDYQL